MFCFYNFGKCFRENYIFSLIFSFEKTCYHAADFGNSQDGTSKNFNVIGGAVKNAVDKVNTLVYLLKFYFETFTLLIIIFQIFTQAGAGTTTISGFCAENYSKVYRSCGMDCVQHQRNIRMTNCRFHGPGLSLICM